MTLRWAHMPFCRFCRALGHFINDLVSPVGFYWPFQVSFSAVLLCSSVAGFLCDACLSI